MFLGECSRALRQVGGSHVVGRKIDHLADDVGGLAENQARAHSSLECFRGRRSFDNKGHIADCVGLAIRFAAVRRRVECCHDGAFGCVLNCRLSAKWNRFRNGNGKIAELAGRRRADGKSCVFRECTRVKRGARP